MKDVPLINFGYLLNSHLLFSFLVMVEMFFFKLYRVLILCAIYANRVVNV